MLFERGRENSLSIHCNGRCTRDRFRLPDDILVVWLGCYIARYVDSSADWFRYAACCDSALSLAQTRSVQTMLRFDDWCAKVSVCICGWSSVIFVLRFR